MEYYWRINILCKQFENVVSYYYIDTDKTTITEIPWTVDTVIDFSYNNYCISYIDVRYITTLHRWFPNAEMYIEYDKSMKVNHYFN